jgi:hypothetical protein
MPRLAGRTLVRLDFYAYRRGSTLRSGDLQPGAGRQAQPDRFPRDFVFLLSADEWTAFRSQSVTSKPGRGGRRYAPFVFTDSDGLKRLEQVDK